MNDATGDPSGLRFSHLFSPQLSPDNRYLYFQVNYATTSNAIYRFDVKTKEARFISTGGGYRVVPRGRCRGYLIASVRKATLSLRIFYWYWLLTPEGKEVGLIGPDDEDAEAFQEARALRRADGLLP